MEEGVYTILSTIDGQALTYPGGGSARPKALHCSKINNEYGTQQYYSQRWLVVRHPDPDHGGWQIVHLLLGFVAGIYSQQRSAARGNATKSVIVEAAPAALTEVSTLWEFQEDKDVYQIHWLSKELGKRILVQEKNAVIVRPEVLEHLAEDFIHRWRFVPDLHLSPTTQFASWMSYIPDTHSLLQLNIPSTHQSLAVARRWIENPRCQERSILEQLNDGIRKFDLRFGVRKYGNDETCLFARHGSLVLGFIGAYLDEYPCLASVLQQMIFFLRRTPSEVLIITISNEDRCEGFFEAFEKDFRFVYEKWFYDYSKFDTMATIQLKDVRSKIILKRADRGHGTDWDIKELPRDELYHGKKYWTTNLNPGNRHAEVDTKHSQPYGNILANITAAVTDTNIGRGYSHNWAASGFPFIKNPIDFAQEARDHMRREDVYAVDKLGHNGSKPAVGEVLLDFYHLFMEECVTPVIRSNPGCGHLELKRVGEL